MKTRKIGECSACRVLGYDTVFLSGQGSPVGLKQFFVLPTVNIDTYFALPKLERTKLSLCLFDTNLNLFSTNSALLNLNGKKNTNNSVP